MDLSSEFIGSVSIKKKQKNFNFNLLLHGRFVFQGSYIIDKNQFLNGENVFFFFSGTRLLYSINV